MGEVGSKLICCWASSLRLAAVFSFIKLALTETLIWQVIEQHLEHHFDA